MAAKTGVAVRVRKMKLRHPELTDTEIARAIGTTRQNVTGVLATFLAGNDDAALRDYQENQADVFDALSFRLLSSVTQEKIANTKPMEAITGAAILIDKARLVRGQATGINVNVLLDVVDAMRARPAQSAANPRVISEIEAKP